MQKYSWKIREEMSDQVLGGNIEKTNADGMTITVQTDWTRDDEDDWPEAARWIKEQFERLRAILSETPSQATEDASQVPHRLSENVKASATEISADQA